MGLKQKLQDAWEESHAWEAAANHYKQLWKKATRPGLTPRGKPMPQTVEEWKYLYDLAEKKMLQDQEIISQLKDRINRLEQKVSKFKKVTTSTTTID